MFFPHRPTLLNDNFVLLSAKCTNIVVRNIQRCWTQIWCGTPQHGTDSASHYCFAVSIHPSVIVYWWNWFIQRLIESDWWVRLTFWVVMLHESSSWPWCKACLSWWCLLQIDVYRFVQVYCFNGYCSSSFDHLQKCRYVRQPWYNQPHILSFFLASKELLLDSVYLLARKVYFCCVTCWW